jgi:hypothetical protein
MRAWGLHWCVVSITALVVMNHVGITPSQQALKQPLNVSRRCWRNIPTNVSRRLFQTCHPQRDLRKNAPRVDRAHTTGAVTQSIAEDIDGGQQFIS